MKFEKDSLSDSQEEDLSEVDHSGKLRNVNILDEDSQDQMLQDTDDLPQKPLHFQTGEKKPEMSLYLYSALTPMADKILFFSIVYYFSFSFPHSLILVSTYAFFLKFFKLVSSQWLREVMDKFPKFNVVIVLTVVKALFAIIVSLNLLLINLLYDQPTVPWNELKFDVMFFFVLLCGVVCHLASSLCCQMTCVEWIRLISSTSSSDPSETDVTSIYHRIHQVSDMFAPFIISGIIYLTTEITSLSVVIGWMLVECILEIILLVKIKNNHPEVVMSTLQSPSVPIQISEDDGFFSMELLRELLRERGLNSYAMILSNFSVLTSTAPVVLNYLVSVNYLSVEVAVVLGLGTGFELLGSIFLPSLTKKIGCAQCSLACLWIYFLLNIASFIPMLVPSSLSKWILMVSLFTSRLFFLGYTYSEKLIFKEVVRNELLEELEMQYSGISSLFSYVLCVFLIAPTRFVIVSGISVCIVFIACILYTIAFWNKRSFERQ